MIKKETSSGHRKRLREKFIRSGLAGFHDYEIIELLLTLVLPRRECKRRAKECIGLFKNLRGFLKASPQELQQAGLTPFGTFCIKLLHELPEEVLKKKIVEQSIYKSSKEIFDYLSYSMQDLKKELFKVIYLNSQNQIIDTADLFEGTLEDISIHPREIIESAINHNATALIFAHNHPSGDPTPSKSDKQFTRDMVFAGDIVQIKMLDHIIIGGNAYFSFADEGLIEKYEDNFLNLKIRGLFEIGVNYPVKVAKLSASHSNR